MKGYKIYDIIPCIILKLPKKDIVPLVASLADAYCFSGFKANHFHHFRKEIEFSGIKNTPKFARTIQKSLVNQTVTLAKTMEKDAEQFTFQCISCSVVMEEERGEYNCPHCGGSMEEEDAEIDEENLCL